VEDLFAQFIAFQETPALSGFLKSVSIVVLMVLFGFLFEPGKKV
jgi:hypothetical protein